MFDFKGFGGWFMSRCVLSLFPHHHVVQQPPNAPLTNTISPQHRFPGSYRTPRNSLQLSSLDIGNYICRDRRFDTRAQGYRIATPNRATTDTRLVHRLHNPRYRGRRGCSCYSTVVGDEINSGRVGVQPCATVNTARHAAILLACSRIRASSQHHLNSSFRCGVSSRFDFYSHFHGTCSSSFFPRPLLTRSHYRSHLIQHRFSQYKLLPLRSVANDQPLQSAVVLRRRLPHSSNSR